MGRRLTSGKSREMVAEEVVEDTMRSRGRFLLLVPSIVFTSIGQGLAAVMLTDLIVYRTCLVSLSINSTDCSMLQTDSGTPEAADLEAKVEPYASMILMTKTLMESILPAVITLFLGPWSDRGGRRPLLLAALSGFTLEFLILSVMCDWDIGPWYLVLALIPANIVGGIQAAILASICYISDTTVEGDRVAQLAAMQILNLGGMMLGEFTAPSIYENYGYASVFGVAAAGCGSALAFTYFFTPETVKDAFKEPIRGLFTIASVRKLLNNTFMKRGSIQRSVFLLAISTLILNTMIHQGDTTTEFLFTRARLGWDVTDYSYFSATKYVLHIVGLCGVFLHDHVPGNADTFLAGLGLVSALGASATKSLAWQSWHMYLATSIGIFGEILPSSMRSIISKFVPGPDVGKAFSLATLLEILSSLVGAPLYALIYSHYLPPIYPSPVHLISSGFYVLLIVFVACMAILIRKSRELPAYVVTAQEDF